ncbi:TetR/AcrR family transcriptional regulator [Pseudodesulfovibrio tunisiensis]|uniref:TetR/AcrR family transcriptional regulator n=1 Tax=Pseudodesulfovibrio tunisiensis TaxID=463192 RepID=UPI001FB41D60|nr:TetR/AcrR family transcriptional regulator [Pseudodesulfovibrio tunisiensis]
MKPKRSDGKATKAKLLDIALEKFAKKGRDGVGIRELAREGEVSLNTVMYHFESKENLYREVVTYSLERGLNYQELFDIHSKIDFSDRQAVSDAMFGIIRTLFLETAREEFIPQSDLIVQTVFGRDSILHRTLLEGFMIFENGMLAFLKRAGIEMAREKAVFCHTLMWSQLLYYVSARDMAKLDLGLEELPPDFYEHIAWKVTRACCREVGLPDPSPLN